jgi:hypothetical protein
MLDRRLVTAKHVKQLAQVVLLFLTGMIAEGFFYSAHAQCAPTDKIYIDPRLVPKPLDCSPRRLQIIGLGELHNPTAIGQAILLQCMRQGQNQPIRIPHGSGEVLVHPTNPCIQQYIP